MNIIACVIAVPSAMFLHTLCHIVYGSSSSLGPAFTNRVVMKQSVRPQGSALSTWITPPIQVHNTHARLYVNTEVETNEPRAFHRVQSSEDES